MVHAAATLASTSVNDGIPCTGRGGKYVPQKNGSPVGVVNTVIGQPPDPVIACVAAM